uniref:Putative secreted protein n=1 Tax=Anopheles triannulatus TaxID=58253 RepID=A0A2M4B6M4_9DIPT
MITLADAQHLPRVACLTLRTSLSLLSFCFTSAAACLSERVLSQVMVRSVVAAMAAERRNEESTVTTHAVASFERVSCGGPCFLQKKS